MQPSSRAPSSPGPPTPGSVAAVHPRRPPPSLLRLPELAATPCRFPRLPSCFRVATQTPTPAPAAGIPAGRGRLGWRAGRKPARPGGRPRRGAGRALHGGRARAPLRHGQGGGEGRARGGLGRECRDPGGSLPAVAAARLRSAEAPSRVFLLGVRRRRGRRGPARGARRRRLFWLGLSATLRGGGGWRGEVTAAAAPPGEEASSPTPSQIYPLASCPRPLPSSPADWSEGQGCACPSGPSPASPVA